MRSKFIKKAYVRTNSAKASHSSFLLIRLEGEHYNDFKKR